ncbi:complement C1q-like protein 4 isoform X1 [Dreissena polymorpha]|nr:complement C1q-like protein 4 isoform X1 [Dreissena polymorpha]
MLSTDVVMIILLGWGNIISIETSGMRITNTTVSETMRVLTGKIVDQQEKLEKMEQRLQALETSAHNVSKHIQTRQAEVSSVAFTACVSAQDVINIGHGQTIVFDQVYTNTGNSYKRTTGIFTAPMDGVYGFHLSVMVLDSNALYLNLVKNGEHFEGMAIYGNGRFTTVSEFWNIELAKGDDVWIRTDTNYIDGHLGTIHGWCHTQFSGFFIN